MRPERRIITYMTFLLLKYVVVFPLNDVLAVMLNRLSRKRFYQNKALRPITPRGLTPRATKRLYHKFVSHVTFFRLVRKRGVIH